MKDLVQKINSEKVNVDIEEFLFDKELKDTILKAIDMSYKNKNKDLDKESLKAKLEFLENKHLNFLEKIEDISIKTSSQRVILAVDGEDLIYDNGEYYIFDSVTKTKKRKITKKEARDLYIEYFIRYQLNPILENKKMKQMVKNISLKTREENLKVKQEEKDKKKKKQEIQKENTDVIKQEEKVIKNKNIER